MKLVIFPDVVMKYCQKNEDVQKIINTGTEKRLEFFCHQIVLDEISQWLSSGIGPVLEEFKKHVEVYTKKLPEELIKKAKQQVSNEGQVYILALAEQLEIKIIWSDNDSIISQFQERITTTKELIRELPKMKPRFIGSMGIAQPVSHQQNIWQNPPITLPPKDVIIEEEKRAENAWPKSDNELALKKNEKLVTYLRKQAKKILENSGIPMITYNYKDEPEIDYISYDKLPNFKMAKIIRYIHVMGSNEGEEDADLVCYDMIEIFEYKRRENQKWLNPWEKYTTETPYLYFDIISFFVDNWGRSIFNYKYQHLYIDVFPEFNTEINDSPPKQEESIDKYPYENKIDVQLDGLLPKEAFDEFKWERVISTIDLNGLKRYFGLRKKSLVEGRGYLQVRFDPVIFSDNYEYIFDITKIEKDLKKIHDAKLDELYPD